MQHHETIYKLEEFVGLMTNETFGFDELFQDFNRSHARNGDTLVYDSFDDKIVRRRPDYETPFICTHQRIYKPSKVSIKVTVKSLRSGQCLAVGHTPTDKL